jgi:hypothetical protein
MAAPTEGCTQNHAKERRCDIAGGPNHIHVVPRIKTRPHLRKRDAGAGRKDRSYVRLKVALGVPDGYSEPLVPAA